MASSVLLRKCDRILKAIFYANERTSYTCYNYKMPKRKYGTKTVYALSSGSGKCAVAVIRVSGPKSELALQQLCVKTPTRRVASVRKLYNPVSQELLDKALVLWLPGPQSFTGEDCAELHVHGGPAVIQSVLEALSQVPGLRPATPGDFTKQAFLNGKLDLTEVEGLGDLIHAETEAQRRQALRQMDGDLGKLYNSWRGRLLKCMANTEAFIDFHEEENIEDDVLDHVSREVLSLKHELVRHLNDSRRGERLRDGLSVVIAGKPNVGKSSLLNSISQRPAAIVSPIAGTTRDIVETSLNIAGYPVVFSDTAGLRDTDDPVEKEGVTRAINRVSSSDLLILMVNADKYTKNLENSSSLSEFITSYMESLKLPLHQLVSDTDSETMEPHSQQNMSNVLVVINKTDLISTDKLSDCIQNKGDNICAISCLNGDGMEAFMENLVGRIKILCGDPLQGSPSLTQTRHRHHLTQCVHHLNHVTCLLSHDVVLAAERLRLATAELGQVTGVVSAEDILDVIFRDFCIGK